MFWLVCPQPDLGVLAVLIQNVPMEMGLLRKYNLFPPPSPLSLYTLFLLFKCLGDETSVTAHINRESEEQFPWNILEYLRLCIF
jgi:hypothetical protein